MNVNLNELRDQAYKTACEHGFHDEELSNEHLLMLVITELAEAVEADRKGKVAQRMMFEMNCDTPHEQPKHHWCFCFEHFIKDSIPDELADAVIYLLGLAGLRGITLFELEELLFDKLNITPEFISWKSQLKEMSFTERMFFLCSLLTSGESIEDVVRSSIVVTFLNANILGVDLLWHIKEKMKYNELRPVMHGKKY